jgi:hypothetical protein
LAKVRPFACAEAIENVEAANSNTATMAAPENTRNAQKENKVMWNPREDDLASQMEHPKS